MRRVRIAILAGLMIGSACRGHDAAAEEVVHVLLLAGQSNMQGVGRVETLSEPELTPQERVELYFTAASSPGSASPERWIGNQPRGHRPGLFGPEVALGHTLSHRNPTQRYALIKHAVGGTSLAEDWHPGRPGEPATQGPQYRRWHEAVAAGLASLRQRHPHAELRVAAMFWLQGESDSTQMSQADAYAANLEQFVRRVWEDVGAPDLPFIFGRVHDVVGQERPGYRYNDQILAAQAAVAGDSGLPIAISRAVMVDSADQQVHGDVADGYRDDDFAHFNGSGLQWIGRAMANAYLDLADPGGRDRVDNSATGKVKDDNSE